MGMGDRDGGLLHEEGAEQRQAVWPCSLPVLPDLQAGASARMQMD